MFDLCSADRLDSSTAAVKSCTISKLSFNMAVDCSLNNALSQVFAISNLLFSSSSNWSWSKDFIQKFVIIGFFFCKDKCCK